MNGVVENVPSPLQALYVDNKCFQWSDIKTIYTLSQCSSVFPSLRRNTPSSFVFVNFVGIVKNSSHSLGLRGLPYTIVIL